MYEITLPDYPLKTRTENGAEYVYDRNRDRYVRLTPEERVRQLFLQFLIQDRNVPAGLITVEHGIRHERKQLRVDIVVHDRAAEPLLLVECKAPREQISQRTFDQVADYNYLLQAPYLVVTNGVEHYCCKLHLESREVKFLDELPDYEGLTVD